MKIYYVNGDAKNTGEHLVHKLGCDYFPLKYNYLGLFSGSEEALDKAREFYPRVDVCPDCCAPRRRRVFFDRG